MIPPEYDSLHVVGYRMYRTWQGNRMGFVSFSGYGTGSNQPDDVATLQRLLPCDYEALGNMFTSEFLPVKQNGKWGFIRWEPRTGGPDEPVLRIPVRYDAVTPFFTTVTGREVAGVYVAEHELEFYINEDGEMLVDITPSLDLLSGQ